MKAAIAAISVGSAALAVALLFASNEGGASRADFVVSSDPNVVVLSVQIRDIIAPGLWQYELFGDGWFRQRGDSLETPRRPSDSGILLGRAEVEAAFADLVDFGVAEADFSRIHQEIEPSYGVLPDGRRFYVGVSEPGAGCVISATFDSVKVGGELVRARAIRFALEPFVSYRSKRPDIRALEGIARVGERVSGWLGQLEEATKGARR